MLDLYCERVGPGLWAEPVNALTNISFVLAAWLNWRMVTREQVQDWSIVIISATIVAIGIGSFLFHTMASVVTRWLDILPVFVFQLFYLGLYSRRVIKLSVVVSGILLLLLLALVFATSLFPNFVNGSLIYAPALLVIFVLGAYHYQGRKLERSLLFVAATVFLLSLILRSVDIQICPQFGLGSHFLWHMLNALVIYLVMRALIVNLSTVSGRRVNR